MRRRTILVIVAVVIIVIAGVVAYLMWPKITGEKKWKATFMETGTVGDWAFASVGYETYKKLKEHYAGVIEWDFKEGIPWAEMTMTVTNKIAEGYNILCLWGAEWGPSILEVAPQHPDVYFIHGAVMGPVEYPQNVNYIDLNEHQGDYLEGLIAGALTKTNKVGIIVGTEFPKVIRMFEAFKVGVREINPNVRFHYVVLGGWTDPTAGRLAALSMIDEGADFIWCYATWGDLGAFRACEERGNVPGTSCWMDKYQLFPGVQVTSNIIIPFNAFKQVVDTILQGKWEPGKEWDVGIRTGDQWLAPYHNYEDVIPLEIKDLVEERFNAIKNGEFTVPEITTKTEM